MPLSARPSANRVLKTVGTTRWQAAIPKHLRKPFKAALDASERGDSREALRQFGECAERCAGPHDPHIRPVLYFGAQTASQQYFAFRGAGQNVPQAVLEEARFCAETLIRAAWEVNPTDPVAAHNVGRFLHDCDDFGGASAMYKIALQFKPSQVESWGNLGTCYANLGDRDAAERCWMKARAYEAEHASGALAQAYIHLRMGDWATGWSRWERRWEDQTFDQGYGRKGLGKRWTGQPVAPRQSLYVHGEQGLGDHVMFARYVQALLDNGIAIAGLETRPSLLRWMEASFPSVPIVSRETADGGTVPIHAYHVSTMSLPAILGTTVATVPPPVSPLRWTPRNQSRPKVALAWCGAAGNPADGVRSIPHPLLAELAGLPVDWVNVQFTPDAALYLRSWLGEPFEDATETCTDVMDTAQVLATCDVVITVDTLTAHLAGTIGVPTLVLHRFDREWRWVEPAGKPERSVWYPSHHQWTQRAPHDWAGLLSRVRAFLTAWHPV